MLLPFESAVQEGRLLGEASVFRAPSLGIVIGAWLVVLPSLGYLVAYLSGAVSLEWGESRVPLWAWVLGAVAMTLWCALLLFVALRTTLHWARRVAPRPPPTLPT
jgi:hypothetical protein